MGRSSIEVGPKELQWHRSCCLEEYRCMDSWYCALQPVRLILVVELRYNILLQETELPLKVKAVPYTFVRRGVPVNEDTYPEPSACKVGLPVPFLAAFIFPVLLPGTHLLLGEKWASFQSGHRLGFEPWTFRMGGIHSNHYVILPSWISITWKKIAWHNIYIFAMSSIQV